MYTSLQLINLVVASEFTNRLQRLSICSLSSWKLTWADIKTVMQCCGFNAFEITAKQRYVIIIVVVGFLRNGEQRSQMSNCCWSATRNSCAACAARGATSYDVFSRKSASCAARTIDWLPSVSHTRYATAVDARRCVVLEERAASRGPARAARPPAVDFEDAAGMARRVGRRRGAVPLCGCEVEKDSRVRFICGDTMRLTPTANHLLTAHLCRPVFSHN